jgi:hypothetical protein
MAAPNMLNPAEIYGRTVYLTPSVNTSVVFLANPANSGQVFKINSIVAANSDGVNAVNATVSIYSSGAAAQNTAPIGGTAFPLISTVSVPANASLIVLDKSSTIYIEENTSLVITTGSANKLTFVASYELIQ